MEFLGTKFKGDDPDVWMRPAAKKHGSLVYEYVLLYTDDCLVVLENAKRILKDEIGKYFTLKLASIGPHSRYLGGRLREVTLETGVKAWECSLSQYVQVAVKNVEQYLLKMAIFKSKGG